MNRFEQMTIAALVACVIGMMGLPFVTRAEEEVGTRAVPGYQSLPADKKRSTAQGMATDESGEVQSRKVPKFKSGKALKDSVNAAPEPATDEQGVQSRGLFSKKKKKSADGGAGARSQPLEQTDMSVSDGSGAGR